MVGYSNAYYNYLQEATARSARSVVPLILEFVQPRSVIDIGCGRGTWLAAFKERGIAEIRGVDGPWVEQEFLDIPKTSFTVANLEEPFHVNRSFDLVVSLEVAEHLSPSCAGQFVDTLVGLGPVVLFSAAIPFQGGDHHVNERWPTFWAEHFQRNGYIPVDCLRRRIWQNDQVLWWYAQNTLFFVRESHLDDYPRLKQEHEHGSGRALPMVHPQHYLGLQERAVQLEERVSAFGECVNALESDLQHQREHLEAVQELRPGYVSLRNVLRTLPTLIRHRLEQTIKKAT